MGVAQLSEELIVLAKEIQFQAPGH